MRELGYGGRVPQAIIEIPRFGFVKREGDGHVDFVSPVPCPFNYGSIPDTLGEDGDPLDAVVLGRRRPRGTRVELDALAEVDFLDGGHADPKLILGQGPLRRRDRVQIEVFFRIYAGLKTALNRARGVPGATAFRGVRYLG